MGDLPKGVSIIICSYNGLERIKKSIEFLVAQQVAPEIPWEIIVVDNASTDRTYDFVQDLLSTIFPQGDFKVVKEPSAGLSLARQKGIDTAKFEYVVFCDDDNWFSPTYIQQIFDHFEKDPTLGIVGGRGIGVLGAQKPAWFSPRVEKSYAIGKQAPQSGAVNFVWGAGMGLRKSAYKSLMANGFSHLNTDRTKDKLFGGGDTEICIGIGRMGYKIWYDDDLVFHHFIPADLISMAYAKKLYYFIDYVSPSISVYQEAFEPGRKEKWSNNWVLELGKNYLSLIVLKMRPASSKYYREPNDVVKSFIVSSQRGKVHRLLAMRGKFNTIVEEIRNAGWNLKKG